MADEHNNSNHSANASGSQGQDIDVSADAAHGAFVTNRHVDDNMNDMAANRVHGGMDGGTAHAVRNNMTVPHNGGIMPASPQSGDMTVPPESQKVETSRSGGHWKAGDKILGRYVVMNELGQGGMGVVYRCLDIIVQQSNTEVAVKALPPEVSHNSAEMDDMRKNYGLVSRLVHQNIAAYKTLEMDSNTGDYYLVMEYVVGESMRSWMRKRMGKNGGMSLQTACLVLQQIALALDAAHDQNIIHRDIKPDNVMIKPDGRSVKVLDFGLAAQIRSSMARISQQDYSLHAGTNLYKAPEQWRGQLQGAATDQYALAVTAYEMLSGHVPFYDDNTDVLKKAVLEETPAVIPSLPPYANNALQVGLAKDPTNRYATCVDFVRALGGENVLSGGGTVEVFNEDDFYLLCARVERYREKNAKMEWDRGQTFGKHLEAFEDDYRAASAARTDQRLQKANEFLKKAETEWQWLEHNLLLRDEAAKMQKQMAIYREKAEKEKIHEHAREAFQQAVCLAREAKQRFSEGRFEEACRIFAEVEQIFISLILEQNIAQDILQTEFQKAESNIEELKKLDNAKAIEWKVKLNAARKAEEERLMAEHIKQLEQDITTAFKNADLAKIKELIKKWQDVSNKTDIAERLNQLAMHWDACVQCCLGWCYYVGEGIEKDLSKAVEWYRKSAEQGNASGQFNLGSCYYNGMGVEKDVTKAVELFRKSAEQSDAGAQSWLGYCYENGYGIEKDLSKAVEWYRKSAEKGVAFAQNNLGSCYYNGMGVEKDVTKAVELFRKSAEQSDAGAQIWLGYCYENGYGVEKDITKAVEWYRKAAAQGDKDAEERLKEISK